MGYIFTNVNGTTKIESDDGRFMVSSNATVKLSKYNGNRLRIMQPDGLGQLLDIDVNEITSIDGSPPSGGIDQVFDQLIAVFPDASLLAGAIKTVNNIPPVDGNVTLTAADVQAVPIGQLTLTGEPNKVPQLDSGGALVLNSASFSAEYGSGSVFITGTGQWLNIDGTSLEIDLIKSGSDTISISLTGIDTGSQPITTTHTPASAADLVNLLYLQTQLSGIASGLSYKGSWNASNNTPALADGVGANGDLYKVSVAGSHDFGSGAISFNVGDHLVYVSGENKWEKFEGSEAVASVNGKVGVVTINKADVGLGSVDNTADLAKPISAATQAALNTKMTLTTPLTGYQKGVPSALGPLDDILAALGKLEGAVDESITLDYVPPIWYTVGLPDEPISQGESLFQWFQHLQGQIDGIRAVQNKVLNRPLNNGETQAFESSVANQTMYLVGGATVATFTVTIPASADTTNAQILRIAPTHNVTAFTLQGTGGEVVNIVGNTAISSLTGGQTLSLLRVDNLFWAII